MGAAVISEPEVCQLAFIKMKMRGASFGCSKWIFVK
jgi:hypothetical protein